jgi:cobalt-zinc-cadmium efflux system outer membrane protein
MRFGNHRMGAIDMDTNLHGWNRKVLLGTVLLALSLPSHAAEIGKPIAGLANMVEQAWRRNPLAAGQEAREAEARAAQGVAAGLTPEPPSISLGNLNDRQGRNAGKQEWEVEFAVPLWLPGQKDARVAEADSRAGETAARRAADKLSVAGEVRDAWWSLAAARTAQSLALRRLDTARALDGDVQKRFKVGELSRIDANLAHGEVLAAETDLIESKAALLQAEQAFRLLTGVDAPAELGDEVVATGRATTEDAAIGDSHPRLAAAATASHSAWARVKVADETRRAAPELSLRVVRDRNDFAEPYGNNIGVKLKIPFSSGSQVRRENSAAQAEAEKADAEMRQTEMRVRQEIERSRRALDAAERQLRMADERRALSADNLRLAEKSFTLGESDLPTLLRIRAAAFETETNYDRQRLSRAAAISRLNQSLGVLP